MSSTGFHRVPHPVPQGSTPVPQGSTKVPHPVPQSSTDLVEPGSTGFHESSTDFVEPVEPEQDDFVAKMDDSEFHSSTDFVEPLSSSCSSNNINKTTTTTTTKNKEQNARVRVKQELERTLPSANGSQAGKHHSFVECEYERLLGDATIREMAKKLAPYQDSMGVVGWVKKLMREGNHSVPGMDQATLTRAIHQYFNALDSQKGKITNPAAWSMKTFPSILQNLAET